jgi:hypothetical protein
MIHALPQPRFFAGAVLAVVIATALYVGRQPEPLRVPEPAATRAPVRGPLRVLASNPRYFSDAEGRAVYLTGAHTWDSLQDMGTTAAPPPFDFDRYLAFLQSHNHNFIRLWRWETSRWTDPGSHHVYFASPQPWARTGPGLALDGKPKFDLRRFDESYFTRLRDRVEAARQRGIYVSIMLFEGWTLRFTEDAWRGHPFHPDNNVNQLDPDANRDGAGLELHTLQIPAVVQLEEAYVRKVVETVNDLDNVLYEIANESHEDSRDWQDHMMRFVRACEAGRPQQHPVGLTSTGGSGADDTARLFASAADWISPNAQSRDYRQNPPPAAPKVVIVDTDHIWGLGGNREWVWKCFTRGLNPIFMDPYEGVLIDGSAEKTRWEQVRRSLGDTLAFASRVNLAAMTPRAELATTGYCLANPGDEYLVYLPPGKKRRLSVDLTESAGRFEVEWFNPRSGQRESGAPVEGGTRPLFEAPFRGANVLYLRAADKAPGEVAAVAERS